MEQEKESVFSASSVRGNVSRQECLDVMKCLLAFLVVLVHAKFTGCLGLGVCAFARIAVPLFFMITGYYYPLMVLGGLGRHVRKIVCLTVVSSLFYCLFSFLRFHIGAVATSNWMEETFALKKLVDWLLYNATPFAGHLWYFYALLYVFLILYIADRFKVTAWLYRVLPFLLFCNYLLNFWNAAACRNFLFMALPYVLLGCLFRKYEKEIRNVFLDTRLLVIGFIASCIGLSIELVLYVRMGVLVYRDHYLFTLPMVVCVFMLALRNPCLGAGSFVALVGRKYSAFIYVIHMSVIDVLNYVAKLLFGEGVHQVALYQNLRPFLAFGLSLAGAVVSVKVWAWWKVCLNKK